MGYKLPQQPRRPDTEFMGDALVYNFLFDRFRLTDDDFSRLTATLPPELKKPAKLWVVIYGTWLFREALRAKYGNEFVKEVLLAARRRLDRKVEGFEEYDGAFFVQALDFWFAQLDDATQGVGTKIQGVELPFELFAAWNFLTLDGDSPLFRQTSIPDHLDLAVADCLEQGKSAILPFIKFAVEIGGPLPTKAKDVTAVVDAAFTKIVREE